MGSRSGVKWNHGMAAVLYTVFVPESSVSVELVMHPGVRSRSQLRFEYVNLAQY